MAGSLAKFRADAAPPQLPSSATISAARNEFESFQIVIAGPATNVTASASTLSGPAGTIPASKIWLYREDLLTIPPPGGDLSSATADAVPGRWPDALVPAVDEIYGEPRNAFPFNVASGETRVIWVDVFVPPGTPHGDYAGTITLRFTEAGTVTVPVSLHVWNFDLPSTSSMRSLFLFAYGAIPGGHGVGWPFSEIRHAYGVLALDHRISLSGIDDGDVSPGHIDATYGDLLRGTAATRLPGAKLTSLQAVLGSGFTYSDWWNYFSPRGLGPTLVAYSPWTCDEPGDWAGCHSIGVAAHTASPQFRTLVTTTIQNAQANVGNGGFQLSDVNIIDPEINALPDASAPPAYQSFLASNPINELWDYESCDTHGCGGKLGVPWPVYTVDSDPVRSRALEWLGYRYGVKGELYYETGYMFTQGSPGPWSTLWAFTGNGDGTLFYPGVPSTAGRIVQSATPSIGGTHDIPIASIRLKLIREGLEDYEYLKLDAALGGNAQGFASAIFPNSTTVPTNVQLMNQREAIARDIEFRNGTGAGGVAVSASPSTFSTVAGGTATSTITVTAQGSYAGTASLTASGLPTGASATFMPASLAVSAATPSGASTLTLSAGAAASGTYAVTVTATDTSGSPSASTTVAWTIGSDFTVAASPSSVSTATAGSTTSTITVTAKNGFSGSVSLTASGAPAGATVSLQPTIVAGSGASILTLGAGSAAPGTYNVIVTGTSGALAHSVALSWTITAPSTGPQPLFVDDFNRTSGLGPSWRVFRGSFSTDGSSAVSGAMTDSGTGNWASVVPSIGTNDYSVVATLVIPPGSFQSGIVARGSGGNFTRDLYSAQIATDGTVNLYRRNGRSPTRLGGVAAGIVAGVPYELKLVAAGSSPVHLEVWLNGTRRLSYDDASASRITGGIPGIVNYDGGVRYDAFGVYAY